MLDVRPTLAEFDIRHAPIADTELGGYLAMQPGCDADCANLLFCEFGHAAVLTATRNVPALGYHICSVLGGRAEEEMVGVNAGAHITTMANKKARRNGTVRALPRKAVCGVMASTPQQDSVSSRLDGTCPEDTPIVVWRRAVVRQSLRQSPVTWHAGSFRLASSHDRGPFAKVVRAGPRGATRTGPLFLPQPMGEIPWGF